MIYFIALIIVILLLALFGFPCFIWGIELLGRYSKWLEKKGWLPDHW
ncbi:MAG TPA: hypothetical protein VM537_13185 [Anaerolineae bacterium]|nr:hypothetical protein [Anaerolineae bacterium]